jgi:hypothetical protein
VRTYSDLRFHELLSQWDGGHISDPNSWRELNGEVAREEERPPLYSLKSDLAAIVKYQYDLDWEIWTLYYEAFRENRIKVIKNDISRLRRAYNEVTVDRYISVSNVPERLDQKLEELKRVSDVSATAQYIHHLLSVSDEKIKFLCDWLEKETYFTHAFEILSKKKYMRRLPNAAQNNDQLVNPFRAFAAVAASGLNKRLDPFKRRAKIIPSERSVTLAKKLIGSLESDGFELTGNFVKVLRSFSEGEADSLRGNISSTEVRIKIVNSLGGNFARFFWFDSTTKGRPYPDVVLKLVNLAGFDMSERHLNRALGRFDQRKPPIFPDKDDENEPSDVMTIAS